MPLFEFNCPDCTLVFERIAKATEAPPECPTCGKTSVIKLVSAPSFHLKGGGWASDGYGKSAK